MNVEATRRADVDQTTRRPVAAALISGRCDGCNTDASHSLFLSGHCNGHQRPICSVTYQWVRLRRSKQIDTREPSELLYGIHSINEDK